jgi:hypothetical protein
VATISGDNKGGEGDAVCGDVGIGNVIGRNVGDDTSSLPESDPVDGNFFLGLGKVLGGSFPCAKTSDGGTFPGDVGFSLGADTGGFAFVLFADGGATGGLNFVGRITSPPKCSFLSFSSIVKVGGSSTEDLGSLVALMFKFCTFS